ncbi:MAG: methyl-accepting chemotaxis protein [Bacillota bacterium]
MKFIIPSGLVVLLVMGVATVYLVRNQKKALVAEVREQAELLEAQVRATRQYLAETLEVALPEAATVEMLKDLEARRGHSVRFVSLDPLNPDNAPQDAFEHQGLEAIGRGGRTAFEKVESVSGTTRYRRIIRDIATSERCSSCHIGVQKGDVIGGLVITIPMDSMIQSANTRAAVLAGSSLGAVVLLILMLGLILRKVIINPLNGQLVSALHALAEGDLTRRTQVTTNDELGRAAKALDGASQNLRQLVQGVRHSAEQVTASSQGLADASTQVRLAVQQVAETANQMAAGAQRQSEEAAATAEGARQLSEMARQVAAVTQEMARGADEAAKLAKSGREAVAAMKGRMEDIQRAVSESGQAVYELGQRSQRVGQITDAITALAEQTNLLALNAAIEAARAGEQGRGFAVVAEEVRKLAVQSRQAAAEIGGLIGEIRADVERAVLVTEAGRTAVAAGAETVASSGQTFEAITQTVEHSLRQIQALSAAAQKMAAASEQMLRSVEEITAVAQQNAAGTEELASTAEEQSGAVEQIATLSTSLAAMANQLLKEVEVFRL